MYKLVVKSLTISACLCAAFSAHAATSLDLGKQRAVILKNYVPNPKGPSLGLMQDKLTETSRNTDKNHTTHIRVQQMHDGFPVFGADAVVHVPKGGDKSLIGSINNPKTTMNGVIYQQLDTDLQNVPKFVFEKSQADKAKSKALELAKKQFTSGNAKPENAKLMVYVDENNKAHWAFLASVYLSNVGEQQIHEIPVYILDAQTLKVYDSWNDMQHSRFAMDKASGGGLGGNKKNVKPLVYDGLQGDLAALKIMRDDTMQTCYLQNDDVEIIDAAHNNLQMQFACRRPDTRHNNVFWDGNMDEVNGGYSPANDALYSGTMVQNMYQQWLGVPMLVKNGKPMKLKMYTHFGNAWENAEWDPRQQIVRLGDGKDYMYPLTSLGVVSHEVSHGYTSQHSNLIYKSQSGGMNESFSDMAAQAAEVFAYGHNSWQIGPEIMKGEEPLRYMDIPSKDCTNPDYQCSIDHVKDFTKNLNVHYSSGIFNRAFYLLATSEGWDVRKAFTVMAHANANYWTATATFQSGACGVMSSAKDLNYDTAAIVAAFSNVGIETRTCQ